MISRNRKWGQIAGADRVRVKAQRHSRRIPVDDHTDKREQGDATEFGQSKLRQSAAVLRGQIRQVVGELIEPVHTGACAR